jgi:hypothetical protein
MFSFMQRFTRERLPKNRRSDGVIISNDADFDVVDGLKRMFD